MSRRNAPDLICGCRESRRDRSRGEFALGSRRARAPLIVDYVSRARIDTINITQYGYREKFKTRHVCPRAFCPHICSAISLRESDGPTIQGTNVSPQERRTWIGKKDHYAPHMLAPYVTGARHMHVTSPRAHVIWRDVARDEGRGAGGRGGRESPRDLESGHLRACAEIKGREDRERRARWERDGGGGGWGGGNCARRTRRHCTRRGVTRRDTWENGTRVPFSNAATSPVSLTPGIPSGIYQEALDSSGWNTSA